MARRAVQVAAVPPLDPAHVQVVVEFVAVGKTGEDGLAAPTEHFVSVPKEVDPAA